MEVITSIFKPYDVRGIYPKQLNEEIAYRIGRAYSSVLERERRTARLKVVVGRDMRRSSPKLKKRLIDGLLDSGVTVIDVDLVSTPTFYFSVAYYGYDGGIQISASHLPKEYNGFKFVKAGAAPISYETGIEDIKNLVLENKFKKSRTKGTVSVKEGILGNLVAEQLKNIDTSAIKPFKVVADAANGMGALYLEDLFKRLPCELVRLNFRLDGSFPSHPPNPFIEDNLKTIKKEIIKRKADLGIALDGDGDRCFFIDETGHTFNQSILKGIIAQLELKDHPGAKIAYDIRPGKITKDLIEEAGGVPVLTKVGHSLIKIKMLEEGIVYAGESSGHHYYKFPYGTFEAPVKLIAELLEYLSGQNKKLSQIAERYTKYFQSGEISLKVRNTERAIRKIENAYKDGKISHLDGLTVEYDDFWFNVRPSNTEPLLRFNLEAVSKRKMKEKENEVLSLIKS